MDIIIFSKDRAIQLDLCIRSIKKYVDNPKITVLVTWSNQDYLDGYAKLLHRHPDVAFIEQGNFKRTLRQTLKEADKYVIMMVDDSIFVNKLKHLNQVFEFLDTETLKCASLMLSPKIDYCYAKDQKYRPMTLKKTNQFYTWNWSVEAPWSDWGYPHQVGGNLWLKDYLLKITRWIRFENPNELESKLNFPLKRRRYNTPWILCFDKQKILTIPANYIPKKQAENRHAKTYSLQMLNDKFMNGYRIKLPKVKSNAINKEIDFEFERG